MNKKRYIKPIIVEDFVDNEVSLVMMSTPPGDPDDDDTPFGSVPPRPNKYLPPSYNESERAFGSSTIKY